MSVFFVVVLVATILVVASVFAVLRARKHVLRAHARRDARWEPWSSTGLDYTIIGVHLIHRGQHGAFVFRRFVIDKRAHDEAPEDYHSWKEATEQRVVETANSLNVEQGRPFNQLH